MVDINSIVKVTSTTVESLVLREGRTPIERVLAMGDVEMASVLLPDCPDVDPYNVVVRTIGGNVALTKLGEWLESALPPGEYYVRQCCPSDVNSGSIQLGQSIIPTRGVMSVVLDDSRYYGVGVISEGSSFSGAVLLAICVPDFLLDTSLCGVFLVQIASTESSEMSIVIPMHDQFCLCLHDSLRSGSEVSLQLRKWYLATGVPDLIGIVDQLPAV